MLASHTPNNEQLKRIFRTTELGKRDKAAKRHDYLDRTILSVRQRQAADKAAIEHGRQVVDSILANLWFKTHCKPNSLASKGLLLTEDEVASEPPTEWLIREVLPKNGIAAVYGPSGSGKSFLVLDMLAAIANGRDWFGYRVKRAPVVYAALEGQAGISQRVQAYRAKNGKMNMRFIKARFDVRNKEHRAQIIDTIIQADCAGGVFCIDTLAASAPGMEENTSKDMGEVINHIAEIQERLGGCVIMVHHSGKDAEKGLRGWSGLKGALDASIVVSRTGSKREWATDKLKEGRDDQRKSFNLEQVHLGQDEDGLLITSCVISSNVFNTTPSEETSQIILKLIKDYYSRGQFISPSSKSTNRAFEIMKSDPLYPTSLKDKELNSLLDDLFNKRLIEKEQYRDDHRNGKERWKVVGA
jgi:hypothetical protein